jgi:putative DNA primase/helicase
MDMKTTRVALDADHPADIAQRFRAACRPNLIQQNGIWYDYTGTQYKPIEAATLDSAVQTYMRNAVVGKLADDGKTMNTPQKDGVAKPFAPSSRDVQEVARSLAMLAEVHKPAQTYRSPSWLDDREDSPRSILPCKNGLLDLETRKLLAHTPRFFCTYCLPLEYKPKVAVPPKWLEFLDETFVQRQHLTDALQEAFGCIISGDRSHEVIFFHRGRTRSGKGTIQTVSRYLVGTENTVSFSFGGSDSTLGDKHGLAGAENALLIQIPDISVGVRASHGACTRLKEISGGDPIPVRPLFAQATTMVLPGVLQCGANGIPNFGTDADALAARLLFFPHDNHIEVDKRDRSLKDPRKSPFLSVEGLTGILNWAIAGLDRLNERGQFEEWSESREMKKIMLRESNNAVAFIDSECELKPGADVDKQVLHHVHRDWCAAQGVAWQIENYFAGRLTRAANLLGVILDEKRMRLDDGARPRHWIGIRLSAVNRVKYYERDAALYDELVDLGEDPDQAALDAIKYEPKSGHPIVKPWNPPEDERDYKSDFDDDDDNGKDPR